MSFQKQSLLLLVSLTSLLTASSSYGAFPDDFESGVILVEETGADGDVRRAMGFNDGGINGDVPGLREFLNNATVDNTLFVRQGRLDPEFGRELDFIHDQRCSWPDGPQNDNLNIVNGVVFAFAKVPVPGGEEGETIWAGGTFEFIKPCRTDRSLAAVADNPSRRLRFKPLDEYKPKEGEVLGFMVAGITRRGIVGRNNIQARTNIAFFRIGEQPGNGVMLTPEEIAELFSDQNREDEPDVNMAPIINALLDE